MKKILVIALILLKYDIPAIMKYFSCGQITDLQKTAT